MRTYLRFLCAHPAWWVTPIVLYAAALWWLAAQLVQTPENPFVYTLY
jgi:hypothetical protein